MSAFKPTPTPSPETSAKLSGDITSPISGSTEARESSSSPPQDKKAAYKLVKKIQKKKVKREHVSYEQGKHDWGEMMKSGMYKEYMAKKKIPEYDEEKLRALDLHHSEYGYVLDEDLDEMLERMLDCE